MDLFTRKGGLSLHYNTMGEGYPVVLVHTAYENASIFQNLAKELAKIFSSSFTRFERTWLFR